MRRLLFLVAALALATATAAVGGGCGAKEGADHEAGHGGAEHAARYGAGNSVNDVGEHEHIIEALLADAAFEVWVCRHQDGALVKVGADAITFTLDDGAEFTLQEAPRAAAGERAGETGHYAVTDERLKGRKSISGTLALPLDGRARRARVSWPAGVEGAKEKEGGR